MKKKLINLAKSYDFETETEFFGYIVDSFYIGNGQARNLFLEMNKENQRKFVSYLKDIDFEYMYKFTKQVIIGT